MTIARVDCPSGASGNMFLGALLDAGLDQAALEAELRTLDLPPWRLVRRAVRKGPIAATHMDFEIEAAAGHGTLSDPASMAAVIAASGLGAPIKDRALSMVRRLAVAEATVHGVDPDHAHFHELGAVDAVLDIVGACVAVDLLDIDAMSTSAINAGTGTVTTSHGVLPVPAPATLQLLEGAPLEIYANDVDAELLTPTGALVLTEFTTHAGHAPPMRVTATGYGAGTADLAIPNVLRVTLGESAPTLGADVVTVIEANVDDMNPEHYPSVSERLFEVGALDVTLTPLVMKKGRPGTLVRVLASPETSDAAVDVLLRETSTLGVRLHDARRVKVPRHSLRVNTPYGEIGVKASYVDGRLRDVAPEADDCARAARDHDVRLQTVYDAARAAAWEAASSTQPATGGPDDRS
ncbi:MAG: nickel pincer cofactor biosynthesis protein LarC [Chloroflexi bacterium]|nr:nickel pincer cofactor biosynthesis protein LarC [Chloroflexota bacterium]